MNVKGPFFVSIGDADKLNAFLEANPSVPRESVFVDNFELKAYDAVGLESLKIGGAVPESFGPPKMEGFGGWWKYLSNVAKVSPSPSETVSSQQVLEAVSRLGGTFVIDGDEVIYQWNDRIPGDEPDLSEVLQAIREHSP